MKDLNIEGFSVIEGLLIFVIVAIIGGAAYYVYRTNQTTNATLSSIGKSNPSTKTSSKTNEQPQSKSDNAEAASKSQESENTGNTAEEQKDLVVSVIDAYKYTKPENINYKDVVVDMTVNNPTSQDLALTLSSFILYDSGNNSGANGGDGAGSTMDNGYKIISEQILKPGQKVTGAMRFNILNQNYSLFTLKYKDQSFSFEAN